MKYSKLEGSEAPGGREIAWEGQLLFRKLNALLGVGAQRPLAFEDLPVLPRVLRSAHSLRLLQSDAAAAGSLDSNKTTWLEKPDAALSKRALWSLVGLLWRAHGGAFMVLGALKVLMLGSSFAGPLLLSLMVSFLDSGPGNDRLLEGLLLVSGLALSFIFSAFVNTQYNIRASILQVKAKGSLTCAVFARALVLPLYAYTDLDLSDGKMTTLIQIDVDRISGCAASMHDLWMLPIQIVVTFVLLYQQVQSAFLAGICIIVAMFPLNKSITARVMAATKGQMGCKDKRVTLMGEALRGMKSVKMLGLEEAVGAMSAERRAKEFAFLSARKYLDAVCVFLWASMPVLVPFSTFAVCTCLFHRRLSVSEVFTTIALLNMLIFPMNAFPWVLNGCVEAGVSVSRVAKVLSDAKGNVNLGSPESEAVSGAGQDADVEGDGGREGKDEDEGEGEGVGEGETWRDADDGNDEDEDEENDGLGSVGATGKTLLSVRSAQFAWTAAPVPPPAAPKKASCCSSFCPCSTGDAEQPLSSPTAAPEAPEAFSLPAFSFSGQAGCTNALVGSVASGKSTLLLGALGEIRIAPSTSTSTSTSTSAKSNKQQAQTQAGEVRVLGLLRGPKNEAWGSGADVAMAYCGQVPVMHSGSVRANILFGAPMETRRYRSVLRGCGLLLDMASEAWPRGDLTSVGHGGGALSGGQRLRVGVARAVYSKAKIILLDAPFSALDHDTAERLLRWIVREAAVSGRTVLLASHSVSLLRGQCQNVMLLQRGQAVAQGSYEELERSSGAFQGLLGGERAASVSPPPGSKQSEALSSSLDDDADSPSSTNAALANSSKTKKQGQGQGQGQGKTQEQDEADPIEAMASGRIGLHVYLSYFRAVGPLTCLAVLVATLLMQASADGMSLWYAHWAEHAADFSDEDFLLWTGAIAGANVLCALLRSFLFAFGGLRAARRFYAALTCAVLSTHLGFFETTSIGRILNRFGKDTDVIDDQLPFMLNIVLAQVFVLLGSFTVISFSNPPILAMLAVVGLLYWRLQNYYRASSRGLRRLDAVQRSPVYAILQDCLANATTIRAMQRGPVFRRQLRAALDRLLTVSVASAAASQWLSVRLQLLGALIAASIALLSTVGTCTGLLSVSPALLGISLVYSLSIVSKLNGLVGSLTETEQEMVSVERCVEYLALRSEFGEPVAGLGGVAQNWSKAAVLSKSASVSASARPKGKAEADADLEAPLLSSRDADEVKANSPLLSQAALEGWPSRGAVTLSALHMRYGDDDDGGGGKDTTTLLAPDALSGVSLHIAAGSRVAIMGRTGSGKSTLLRVLLGLSPYYAGSAMIDGVEVKRVPRALLRARLSIIPQDPCVLSGPLRLSLDPWCRHGDSALAQALLDCGFVQTMKSSTEEQAKEEVAEQTDLRRAHELLELELVDGGSNLSLGQRQLVCLGRALLRGSRLVLLDEFSSSVCPQAEALLYAVLERSLERTGSTLLVITHREPPLSCGQLLTMAEGRVVSLGAR